MCWMLLCEMKMRFFFWARMKQWLLSIVYFLWQFHCCFAIFHSHVSKIYDVYGLHKCTLSRQSDIRFCFWMWLYLLYFWIVCLSSKHFLCSFILMIFNMNKLFCFSWKYIFYLPKLFHVNKSWDVRMFIIMIKIKTEIDLSSASDQKYAITSFY